MRIIECYIENFGRISNKRYDFRSGLNCIREDNGSGKTTLAAFIKAMLYGFNDTKKLNLEENDRKHYLPWQGGVCGGSLTFEAGGMTYRVERSFSAKASDDKMTVYDTATGRETDAFSEGIGETLFGIDADGFERTVFLSERALAPASENKSISAKLSDLVGCDGDIGSMDDAMKRLEDQRRFYHKKGGSGELSETKAKIDEITRRLDSLCQVEKSLTNAREKMAKLSTDIEKARESSKALIKEREEATLRAAETDYQKQYAEKKQSLELVIRRRTEVGEIFGLNIPTYAHIDEASYKATEAKNLLKGIGENEDSREFNRLSEKFDGKIEKSTVDELKVAINALKNDKIDESNPEVKKARKVFTKRIPTKEELLDINRLLAEKNNSSKILLCLIPFSALSVVGLFVEIILTLIGLVGIVATITVWAMAKSKAKKEMFERLTDFFNSVSGVNIADVTEAKARLNDMEKLLPCLSGGIPDEEKEELNSLVAKTVLLFPEYYSKEKIASAEEIIREYERYAELTLAERYLRSDRSAKAERAERLQKESNSFLEKYKTKTSDPFSELRAALNEYDRLTAEIVAKRDEMARLESLHAIGEGNQKKAMADIEIIDRKRYENEEKVTSLSREYALTERMYNSYSEELEMRDELIMKRHELEEVLEKHKDNYETILLTKKYITMAKDNMTVRYLGKTKEGFLKYAEQIGGISDTGFEMDTDFSIKKQEGALTKPTEAYSRGTRDLFNLAARLALVDSLYEKEKPFIILDDPFTALDDSKTSAALRLVKNFSKERQIIYFTCSRSRSV